MWTWALVLFLVLNSKQHKGKVVGSWSLGPAGSSKTHKIDVAAEAVDFEEAFVEAGNQFNAVLVNDLDEQKQKHEEQEDRGDRPLAPTSPQNISRKSF